MVINKLLMYSDGSDGMCVVNVPISLTMFRVAVIPMFVMCFYWHNTWAYVATVLLFSIAALTDWLDGHLARSWSQTSKFGEFLDPVADKLMVCSALVLLANESTLPYIAIPVVLIICREITISALREWMAEIGQRANVAVSCAGKVKTTLQMSAIIVLLIARQGYFFYHAYLEWVGGILLLLASLLSVWTLLTYSRAAWACLRPQNK